MSDEPQQEDFKERWSKSAHNPDNPLSEREMARRLGVPVEVLKWAKRADEYERNKR